MGTTPLATAVMQPGKTRAWPLGSGLQRRAKMCSTVATRASAHAPGCFHCAQLPCAQCQNAHVLWPACAPAPHSWAIRCTPTVFGHHNGDPRVFATPETCLPPMPSRRGDGATCRAKEFHHQSCGRYQVRTTHASLPARAAAGCMPQQAGVLGLECSCCAVLSLCCSVHAVWS